TYTYMSDTTIRLSKDVKRRLDLYKREDESYEDVIVRLTRRDKWAGFGILADSDTATREGMEKIREQMRQNVSEEINSMK
ncbi:MAG: antitoxin VapB family protein, partial [Halobacteriaceae archaeon]